MRLSLLPVACSVLSWTSVSVASWISICLPAVGQGALAIECREDDQKVMALLARSMMIWRIRLTAERALNRHLQGGCQAHCRLRDIANGRCCRYQ